VPLDCSLHDGAELVRRHCVESILVQQFTRFGWRVESPMVSIWAWVIPSIVKETTMPLSAAKRLNFSSSVRAASIPALSKSSTFLAEINKIV